jgi:hypothetical protein
MFSTVFTEGPISKVVVEWLALLTRIREVPGSNLSPEIGYPDWGFRGFPQSLQAHLKLGHDRFLLNPSQFIIHLSPFILRCTLWLKKFKLSRYRYAAAKGERKSNSSFLTSALDGGEWSASCLGRVLPRGKDPRYPLDRRRGGPQSCSGHRG